MKKVKRKYFNKKLNDWVIKEYSYDKKYRYAKKSEHERFLSTKKGSMAKKFEKWAKKEELNTFEKMKLEGYVVKKRSENDSFRLSITSAKMVVSFMRTESKLINFFIAMRFDYVNFASKYKLNLEDVTNIENWQIDGGIGTFKIPDFVATIYYDYDKGTTYDVVDSRNE